MEVYCQGLQNSLLRGARLQAAVRAEEKRGKSFGEGVQVKQEANILLEKHMAEIGLEFDKEFRFHPQRLWRADYRVTNRLHNGQMMLIEIEGGIFARGRHVRGAGYQKDLDKYNHAVKLGYGVLRFSTHDVLRGRARAFLQDLFGRAAAPRASGSEGET